MYSNLRIKIRGLTPLLQHNGDLANPTSEIAQHLSVLAKKAKKAKTAQSYVDLAEAEMRAGLYLNDDQRVVLPAEVLEAAIRDGAKQFKEGRVATSSLFVEHDALLDYDGPKHVDKIVKDRSMCLQRMVKINRAKVLRSRPIFRRWAAEFVLSFDTTQTEETQIERWLISAARRGVGDWRPKYGRFSVEKIEKVN